MKKTRFIMLALVAALVLMGAAYAAWSQTFTINSTVSTGELFVLVSNNGFTSVRVDANGDGDYADDPGDVVVTSANAADYYLDYPVVTTTDGDTSKNGETTLSKIKYDFKKLYPGTQFTSQITFENKGTLKTKAPIATAATDSIVGDALWDDMVIKVNGNAITGTDATKLTNLANAISEAVGDLAPGATKTVTIVQELPIGSGNDTENKTGLNWETELTFEQYNDLQTEE